MRRITLHLFVNSVFNVEEMLRISEPFEISGFDGPNTMCSTATKIENF